MRMSLMKMKKDYDMAQLQRLECLDETKGRREKGCSTRRAEGKGEERLEVNKITRWPFGIEMFWRSSDLRPLHAWPCGGRSTPSAGFHQSIRTPRSAWQMADGRS